MANKRQAKAHREVQQAIDKPIIMGKLMLGQLAEINKVMEPKQATQQLPLDRINDSKLQFLPLL